MSEEEKKEVIDKNRECSVEALIHYTTAQDAEKKQEDSKTEQNETSEDFYYNQNGGREYFSELKVNDKDKVVDCNLSVCVDIYSISDNVMNASNNSIEQIVEIEQPLQQNGVNGDDSSLFTSSLPIINSVAVGNGMMRPVENNYNISSDRDCESHSEILDSNLKNDDTIIIFSPIPATPQKIRHRRLFRSRSWCARTRNDSLNTTDFRLLRERLLRAQSNSQPSALWSFTTQQKMILVSLAMVDFMGFCSMSIMAPFFPREANEKGMSDSVSGFVFSFFAFVMFFASLVFGKILPSVGPKFMLMAGIFVAGCCNLLFGVLEYIADYETFATFCFLIRGLEALGTSAHCMASTVYVINSFPNHIGTVFGILETCIGLGMSVGPAIGGLLYSVGGFGLPFYVLGIAMVLCMPLNYFLLPVQTDCTVPHNTGSLLKVVKVPTVVITSIVIVVMSNIWAFLDPTLEPHMRQFNLNAHQVGLIFLLSSALYGISSPLWGCLADRINNQWCMMVWGLVITSVGLLLLGPSPLLPFLKSSLWLNLLGLSILGISAALTLLPTFQGVLTSTIEEAGCSDNIVTYSIVAGVWSSMYSLGEVIGPSVGGVLLKSYGFPVLSTIMATLTFFIAIIILAFFSSRPNKKSDSSESSSDDSKTDGVWQILSGSCRNPGVMEDGAGVGSVKNGCLLDSDASWKNNMKKQRQSYGGTGVTSQEFRDFIRNQRNYNTNQNAGKDGGDFNTENR